MTTIETITSKQIVALMSEASEAGDTKMVKTCMRALDGKIASIEKSVAAINANEANR